jgi:hypothetical protein
VEHNFDFCPEKTFHIAIKSFFTFFAFIICRAFLFKPMNVLCIQGLKCNIKIWYLRINAMVVALKFVHSYFFIFFNHEAHVYTTANRFIKRIRL